jgi:hypothetical protein
MSLLSLREKNVARSPKWLDFKRKKYAYHFISKWNKLLFLKNGPVIFRRQTQEKKER